MSQQFESTTVLSGLESLQIVRRTLAYAWGIRYRYLVKLCLAVVAIFPPLILVWPFKIIIDNVILGNPIEQSGAAYPSFIQPFIDILVGESPLVIMIYIVIFGFITIVLMGAFGESGTTSTQRDGVNSDLADGTDVATRTENEANKAQSSIGGIMGYLEFLWTIRITHLLNYRLRAEVYQRLQSLPMSTLEDERIGDAVYRVMYDTPAITDLCDKAIVVPVQGVAQIFIILMMLQMSFNDAPELFWIALSALPLFFVVFMLYTRRLRKQWEISRDQGATTTASMEESLGNMLAVQSLGGQKRELTRFAQTSQASFRGYLLGYGLMMLVSITGIFIFGAVVMYALTIMTDLIIEGILSPGDLVVIYVFYRNIFTSARRIGGLWLDLQFPIAGMRRVYLLMNLPLEEDVEAPLDLAAITRGLRFRNVSFSYPDGTEALRDISLEAGMGQMIALVGSTGAGKTSLAYMIPRFHNPSSGEVYLDDQDIAGVSLQSLRSQIAFVFQETTLFDGTVEENIRIAKPDATDLEIRTAASVAGADEFIKALPHGYKSHLGTKGDKLSVGQKQRISIARGLVRNAPILILDEPTSALDPETENNLVQTLHRASQSKLVIVVAHRLSTIRAADQILFLDDGKILERGTHEELMTIDNGAYRQFVMLQTKGAA
ncbi:MAG: ABC transporter ATP-binding protein [Pseudomonadales bacterium]|jgi:ABC-type multidrug transport system fused ATPase/permease subunit|nr:ABC transporter ATP-binding protein [Pseudomonadales bacterium]MDP7357929.1 ABC transporter ATP-binding protein [Pseudomonadales bacterium]MDP7595609.1 ABC transporter ATP-binding protein [Pseudomonadales bacterium]HJN50349.1 ABC transporter ATP-binding protein [Pseudomonadales bacterium]|tara:strand:- start:8409 stop:10391 length:1983 start_codon:yes stop_codon:yes gene_type:complete